MLEIRFDNGIGAVDGFINTLLHLAVAQTENCTLGLHVLEVAADGLPLCHTLQRLDRGILLLLRLGSLELRHCRLQVWVTLNFLVNHVLPSREWINSLGTLLHQVPIKISAPSLLEVLSRVFGHHFRQQVLDVDGGFVRGARRRPRLLQQHKQLLIPAFASQACLLR